MNMREMLTQVRAHPILQELSLDQQLGIPEFDVRNGNLLVKFRAHREQLVRDRIFVYRPDYYLEFIYPFNQLLCFRSYLYDTLVADQVFVVLDAQAYLEKSAEHEARLFQLGNELLAGMIQQRCIPDNILQEYRATAYAWMQETNTLPIYSEEV